MAKKKGVAREFVWLQCTESGDLNYRTSLNTKGGLLVVALLALVSLVTTRELPSAPPTRSEAKAAVGVLTPT